MAHPGRSVRVKSLPEILWRRARVPRSQRRLACSGQPWRFASVAPSRRRSPRPIDRGRHRHRRGAVVQLNLAFFDPSDPPEGPLWESLAPSLWEQLDEPARYAALEILARLIARMLVTAANEASHE